MEEDNSDQGTDSRMRVSLKKHFTMRFECGEELRITQRRRVRREEAEKTKRFNTEGTEEEHRGHRKE
jgi:hypothetical protein